MSPVIELTGFRGQPAWELLAAQYLLMIQAGAWAMLAGCLPRVLGLGRGSAWRFWSVLAATGLALAAPLNLVAELLAPERFATLLFRVNPFSPLSWGVAAILALTLCGLLESRDLWRGDTSPSRLIPSLACLAALGALAYTFVEVDRAAGIPLWTGPWPGVILAASGLAAGLGVCLGLVRLAGAPAPLAGRLAAALGCAVSGLALFGWGALTAWPALPDWPLGWALPAGAGLAFLLATRLFASRSAPGLAWACLLAVGAAWAVRAGILMAGQAAALGRDLGEPHLAGHAGLLSALAPAALWVFLMLVVSLAATRAPALSAGWGGRP